MLSSLLFVEASRMRAACRSDNSCSTTTMDTQSREKRGRMKSEHSHVAISRVLAARKADHVRMEKPLGEATLGLWKIYHFLITSEDFPSLVSLSNGSHHISSQSSFLYEQRLSTASVFGRSFMYPSVETDASSTSMRMSTRTEFARFIRIADGAPFDL